MLEFNKQKQSIIIVLAILFLLGRVMDLHAHGHIDAGTHHHNHPQEPLETHHHDHTGEKIHIASHLNDSHNFDGSHDDHGEKLFDIENTALVKKQNQSNDTNLIFLFVVISFLGVRLSTLHVQRLNRRFIPPIDTKFYLKHQPLRAPPFFA